MPQVHLKIVTHYQKDDVDFDYDYSSIEIFDEKDQLLLEYGDYYHDKGSEKVEGFLKGVEWVTGEKPLVEEVKVADSEY